MWCFKNKTGNNVPTQRSLQSKLDGKQREMAADHGGNEETKWKEAN